MRTGRYAWPSINQVGNNLEVVGDNLEVAFQRFIRSYRLLIRISGIITQRRNSALDTSPLGNVCAKFIFCLVSGYTS